MSMTPPLANARFRLLLLACALALLAVGLPVKQALGGNGAFTTAVSDHVFLQLLLDPVNSRVVYAAGNDAQHVSYVYKSFDGGATWASASNGLGAMDVYAMAIARTNPQLLYVGGYNPNNRSLALYQSSNGGATWSQVPSTLGDTSIQSIAIDPTSERIVYLATNHGVYKSTDATANFTQLTGMGSRNVHVLVNDKNTALTLYAGTDANTDPGVWKTADGGATWSQINNGLASSSTVFVLAMDHTQTQTLYAGVGSNPYSLYKTTNAGQAWSLLVNTDPIYSIAVDPLSGMNVLYSTASGVYRSSNGGTSFDLIFQRGSGPVLADANSPQTIYVGGQGISTYTSAPPPILQTATPGGSGTPSPSGTPLASPTPFGGCVPLSTPVGSGGSYTFSQTGHTVLGIWLDFVKSHGDVDNLGYPRSEVICDPITGQTVQYFQRVVLEFHPEQAAPYQLQRRLLVDSIYPGPADAPVSKENPPPGDVYYFANGATGFGHFVANFLPNSSPTYFKQYFDGHGKEDTFGYPKEEPKLRTGADGVQRWTQRYQAAVFEYHPENDKPGLTGAGIPIRTYRVQLELVGDEYIAKNNLGLK
jgi:photosystem II stability/assembly factor-like uncharacterized protein